MAATAGVTYTYDGDGKRVSKSNRKVYCYGIKSQMLAESATGLKVFHAVPFCCRFSICW